MEFNNETEYTYTKRLSVGDIRKKFEVGENFVTEKPKSPEAKELLQMLHTNASYTMMSMSFGPTHNQTDMRRKTCMDVIQKVLPDIICVQEISNIQKDLGEIIMKDLYHVIHTVKKNETSQSSYEAAILAKKACFDIIHERNALRLSLAELREKGNAGRRLLIGSWHGRKYSKSINNKDMGLKEKKGHLQSMREKVEVIAGGLPWVIGGNFNINVARNGQPSQDIGYDIKADGDYFLFDHEKMRIDGVKAYELTPAEAKLFQHQPIIGEIKIREISSKIIYLSPRLEKKHFLLSPR